MNHLIKITITLILLSLNLNAETLKSFVEKDKHTPKSVNIKPFYQGEVVQVLQAKEYTYLQIKENTNLTFWVTTNAIDAKIGDFVRFQKELVTQNFKSKTLNKVFKELMFVSHLEYRI